MGFFGDLVGTIVNHTPLGLLGGPATKALSGKGGMGMGNPYDDPERKAKREAFRKRLGEMQSQVDSAPGPQALSTQPLGMEKSGYKAKTFDQPLAEFDYARKKANESIGAQNAEAQDAMARRFARLGTMNSGSAIKQAQIAEDAAAKQRADAMESIGAQEAQAKRALAQDEANKEFQSEESMRGRNASREQFNAQSDFAMQQFNADQTFKDKVFRFDSNSKLAALDLQDQQGELAAQESFFNRQLANEQMKRSGGLFGGGGFLGLGL